MASTWMQVRIDSLAQSPTSVVIGMTVLSGMSGPYKGGLQFHADKPGTIGPWCGELRRLLAGAPTASPIGCGAWLEFDAVTIDGGRLVGGRLVAVWDLARMQRLERPTEPPPGPSARDVAAALKHINRRRAQLGERPLDPERAGWTDDDVITDARRLGWRT